MTNRARRSAVLVAGLALAATGCSLPSGWPGGSPSAPPGTPSAVPTAGDAVTTLPLPFDRSPYQPATPLSPEQAQDAEARVRDYLGGLQRGACPEAVDPESPVWYRPWCQYARLLSWTLRPETDVEPATAYAGPRVRRYAPVLVVGERRCPATSVEAWLRTELWVVSVGVDPNHPRPPEHTAYDPAPRPASPASVLAQDAALTDADIEAAERAAHDFVAAAAATPQDGTVLPPLPGVPSVYEAHWVGVAAGRPVSVDPTVREGAGGHGLAFVIEVPGSAVHAECGVPSPGHPNAVPYRGRLLKQADGSWMVGEFGAYPGEP